MRTAVIPFALSALLAAPVALAHDGPHGEEGLPLWLWGVIAIAVIAGGAFVYRALYRAARARDAAAAEEDQ